MTEQESSDSPGNVDGDETSDESTAGESVGAVGEEPERDVGEDESLPDDEETADRDGATADGDEETIDAELVERVESEEPEAIAREIVALQVEIDGLRAELEARETEIDELTSKLKRKQADFENYKKRMKQRHEKEQQRATEGLVRRILDVRDNLQRALDQDEGVDVRDGVESTLRQFDDVLAAENVEPIEPEPGDEVNPHRHEVLARIEAAEPEGTIATVHRPGYEMAGAVVREAQVAVSDGGADDAEEATETVEADASDETASDSASESDGDGPSTDGS